MSQRVQISEPPIDGALRFRSLAFFRENFPTTRTRRGKFTFDAFFAESGVLSLHNHSMPADHPEQRVREHQLGAIEPEFLRLIKVATFSANA